MVYGELMLKEKKLKDLKMSEAYKADDIYITTSMKRTAKTARRLAASVIAIIRVIVTNEEP